VTGRCNQEAPIHARCYASIDKHLAIELYPEYGRGQVHSQGHRCNDANRYHSQHVSESNSEIFHIAQPLQAHRAPAATMGYQERRHYPYKPCQASQQAKCSHKHLAMLQAAESRITPTAPSKPSHQRRHAETSQTKHARTRRHAPQPSARHAFHAVVMPQPNFKPLGNVLAILSVTADSSAAQNSAKTPLAAHSPARRAPAHPHQHASSRCPPAAPSSSASAWAACGPRPPPRAPPT